MGGDGILSAHHPDNALVLQLAMAQAEHSRGTAFRYIQGKSPPRHLVQLPSHLPSQGEALEKDFFLLVDAVMDPVEEMCRLVLEARKYFKSYSINSNSKTS